MKIPSAWPVVVERNGSSVKIYKVRNNGTDAFKVVNYIPAGKNGELKRQFKAFADYDKAWDHAHQARGAMSRQDTGGLALSSADAEAFKQASAASRGLGVKLNVAVDEWADAKTILGGRSLIEAARYFAKKFPKDMPSKTVEEVFNEILEEKRELKKSPRYIQDLDSRLGAFAEQFQMPLAKVTGPMIKAWLQGLDISNRTRNNFRIALQTFFTFAKKTKKYLPSDWNELDAVEFWEEDSGAIEIFTPAEISTLLSSADENMVPFLLLGAFAGMRSAEISRLDWSAVSLKTGHIKLEKNVTKTKTRRVIPMSDNLKAWLAPYAKASGPVMEIVNVPNAIQRLVDATRPEGVDDKGKLHKPAVNWKHNALRHSYCSYRLAVTQNAAQVALEAGNSPRILLTNYDAIATKEEGASWFAIMPVNAENVVPMGATK